MPCPPLMCSGAHDCPDSACPGNPKGVAAYFEEMDRQSKAHHAAMHRKLGGGTFYPPVKTLKRVERFSLRFFVALVIGLAAWAIFLNLPLLRWALN